MNIIILIEFESILLSQKESNPHDIPCKITIFHGVLLTRFDPKNGGPPPGEIAKSPPSALGPQIPMPGVGVVFDPRSCWM